jgi:translation initiation factor 3 subunit E
LNLSKDEGEKWIVNLIRETRMGADAKIDLEKVQSSLDLLSLKTNVPWQNVIEIHRPALPIYQSVIEKTRGLAFRTQAMGTAMARPPQAGGQQGESNPVAIVDGAQ